MPDSSSLRPSRSGSIRARLLTTFLLTVLLPLVAISAVQTVSGLQGERLKLEEQLRIVAESKGAQIRDWLRTLMSDLNVVLDQSELSTIEMLLQADPASGDYQASAETVRDALVRWVEQARRFDTLFLIDPEGRVLVSTDESQVGRLYSGAPFFQRGLIGPALEPPRYWAQQNRPYIIAAQPIRDQHRRVIVVLAGRISLDALQPILSDTRNLGETGEAYLVDRDRSQLLESRFGEAGTFVFTEGANTALRHNAVGSGAYYNQRGQSVIGVYYPLPELDAALLVEQNRSELLQVSSAVLAVYMSVVLAGVAIAAYISLLITRSIAQPLADVADTVSQIAAGRLDLSVEVEREDEVAVVARAINTMTGQLQSLIGSLEEQVEARTQQLRVSADVGRAAASILDPNRLMREVVDLISDRFGFYYAALFTIDLAGQYAVLREATGEAGRVLKERGHRLEVGGKSMVGMVTATRKPRIALDVGAEAVRFANPLLPDTRSEIALPLAIGERVLGALDVQSTQEAAFDEASVAVLQGMADQVAIALANAQLFDTVQVTLQTTMRQYEFHRQLFAATSPREVYDVFANHAGALLDLDHVSLMMITSSDVDGQPTQYELVAEWDAVQGARVLPGLHYTPEQLPLAGLVDRESVVYFRTLDDLRLPRPVRLALEQAGARAAVLVPILIRAQFEGFLMAVADQPLLLSDAALRAVQTIVEQVAVTLGSLHASEETRNAMERIALLNQRLSGQAWRQYLASSRGLLVESGSGDDDAVLNRLAAPIVVRGETLGMLDLEDVDPDRQWSDEDWELLNMVAGEVALAIESARLIEQTQFQAAREAELNRIGQRLRRATDIQSILRVAAEELGTALDTSHANVRLGPPSNIAGHPNGH